MIKMKPNDKRLRRVFVGLVCCLLLFTIVPRAKTIFELSARKKELLQEKARLTQVNTERCKTLDAIDSPEGIERIAREQLGMVKNGEKTIIKVIPNK